MKDKIFGVLQRVGRSFMLPIALLPVAGLLLGLGSSLTNATTLQAYGLEGIMGKGTILYSIFTVMAEAGNVVFANLPLLFAIGVAIGMAKQEKDVAALSAVVAFLIMHASINAMLVLNKGEETLPGGSLTEVLGITSLQMGVFGGIIVGLGVAALHNRFYKIELPQVLSFFGGTRFVPIISSLVFALVGILLYFIWPVVQSGIYAVGELVMKSGYAGTWLYGFMERLLIPFGLHHVFYLPFWQTAVGGTMVVGGRLVEGAQNIFFAQLAEPSVTSFSVEATRFMSGKFPLMIFGLPGAALAMYKTARPEKKKTAAGLLLSAALTSMITGITEPLEFTFLFVAPGLYAIHCIFAGFAYMLMHIFNVGVGMTFSGGLIDLFLFGILQGNTKTNWVNIIWVGIIYFVVYYFVFSYLIKKLNIMTPGRDKNEEVRLYGRADVDAEKQNTAKKKNNSENISAKILEGLGGRDNVSDIDCCATRLRCTVFDGDRVNQEVLKSTGAVGVICKGEGVQIIYGPQVSNIKSELCEYMGSDMGDAAAIDKGEKNIVKSPMTGHAYTLDKTPDEAFSSGVMGDGMVVEPVEPDVLSPVDGKITFVFPSRHAIGLVTKEGTELLLHIGIDTVKLEGKGFEVFVSEGDEVMAGDRLMRLDLDYIRKNAPSLVSPLVCTSEENIQIIKTGEVTAGDEIFSVEKLL